MSQVTAAGQVYVWRATRNYRLIAAGGSTLLALLSILVLLRYHWFAVLGVALVMAAIVRTYWLVVRPSLTAGPGGLDIVWERTPVHLDWTDVRRVDPTIEGLKITLSGGREVTARYPQKPPVATKELTEADLAAAYLAQRAAWARKPTGPEPTYTPPAAPAKKN
jgi:hypothetical protein